MIRVAVTVLLVHLLIRQARGGVEADIVTDRGTVTVVLAPEVAPLAVANFIGLAEGSRNRVDPVHGGVESGPHFNGRSFRATGGQRAVMGHASFEECGFCFADEFSVSLRHDPYVLAMDNVGPNTNGASWYLTGNVSAPERDDRFVVFGRVMEEASRSVVDIILTNPPETTTVSQITIRRTGPVGEGFDESSAGLPEVLPAAGPIRVGSGAVELWRPQAEASVVLVTRTDNLIEWQPCLRRMRGRGEAGFGDWIGIDIPSSRAFYHPAEVSYPEGDLPSGFANRTLSLSGPGIGTLTYHFDGSGLAGRYENTLVPGEPPFFEGDFTVRTDLAYRTGPVSFEMMIEAEGLGGSPFNQIVGGSDHGGEGGFSGRHRTTLMSAPGSPVFTDDGDLELTAAADD